MSFSYETKNELCRLPVQRHCCARAEAYGILLYCHTFNSTEVRIITENPGFAQRLRCWLDGQGLSAWRLELLEPDNPGAELLVTE